MSHKIPRAEINLLVLDPGHFHAALIQKKMLDGVSPVVHVYAPEGEELKDYLNLIRGFNNREQNPTCWDVVVHSSVDFLEVMLKEKLGNLVILAGNNHRKPAYLKACIDCGMNVLSDKPLCINAVGFASLRDTFSTALQRRVLLSDIMTERFEITSILQRRIMQSPAVFGTLESGTPEQPAIVMDSVHYLLKKVAGKSLLRPPWYFDVRQHGEGIVDVSTHLVDLVMWTCFPGQAFDFRKDIQMIRARHWATKISKAEFRAITGIDQFPYYLKRVTREGHWLTFSCNGEMVYRLTGSHVGIRVSWRVEDPEGGEDRHFSLVRGSKANILIRQGREENFVPELFIEPVQGAYPKEWSTDLNDLVREIDFDYPGVTLSQENGRWHLLVPDNYRIGHEAHFAQVIQNFLGFLQIGQLPSWEVPNMLAKYFTTTEALKLSMDH